MSIDIKTVPTKPFEGQKPGTSGLRKRVKVFQQPGYTENFVQATLSSIPAPSRLEGSTLVVGGDGRYFSPEVAQIILCLAAGNKVKKIIIGQHGILSTPATSHVIRKRKADGGILLTASHNPGGPDADFGIKYNISNGGPAPESVTNKIYEVTKSIQGYHTASLPHVDIARLGVQTFGDFEVEVIDSTTDYVAFMKTIFDFELIKSFLHNPKSGRDAKPFKVIFDALHGVTGPYGKAIFEQELGLDAKSTQNCIPSPNFGGGHPDPNLVYAHSLVERVDRDKADFGAASDGDGDRNMIYGAGELGFVSPCDSVAVIAHHATSCIPYFKKDNSGKLRGLARSMPTSGALDLVAQKLGVELFEVPTGWKFFGNLMDAGRLSICGEESFGTGSDHIREKDGMWAVMAWLNILAAVNQEKPGQGIKEVLLDFYAIYGRSFFSRYDFEEVDSEGANRMIAHLNGNLQQYKGQTFEAKSTGEKFKVKETGDFEYKDPIDHSISKNQGIYLRFEDGSRVVFRLSGTGSQGATVRMYVEKYESKGTSEAVKVETQKALKGLIEVALTISQLESFTGRSEPTVIT